MTFRHPSAPWVRVHVEEGPGGLIEAYDFACERCRAHVSGRTVQVDSEMSGAVIAQSWKTETSKFLDAHKACGP